MLEFKKIWTLDEQGNEVLRDLYEESKKFSWEEYYKGNFDPFNVVWHETFNSFVHDDNGCDYERYGTHLRPDDVVLDVGGNIGMFSYRAEYRGVKKIYSFEPMRETFNCLTKNVSEKTRAHNLGVASQSGSRKFIIPENFKHCGGGTSQPDDHILNKRGIIKEEIVQVIGINDIFEEYPDITYMKIDVEGDETDILPAMTDENLLKLRCLVGEFHHSFVKTPEVIDPNFYKRMEGLGFKHFTLYHSNGNLRTFHFWQENYEK